LSVRSRDRLLSRWVVESAGAGRFEAASADFVRDFDGLAKIDHH